VPANRDERLLLSTLTALTMVSGVVDAVCYVGLGHVFTANMTGNVVVLGFALVGAPGFSKAECLTSLAAFVIGAIGGGRLHRRIANNGRLLIIAMIAEATLVCAVAVLAFLVSTAAGTGGRYMAIVILGLAMGVRNAVVRHLAVRDLTTTVLTQTLTGLAADSRLAGGSNPRGGRRGVAVVAMLVGAIIGAAVFLHEGAGPALLIGTAVTTGAAIAFWLGGAKVPAST
jgi:uncharacterized membrane protein YoaK (UPF0700 family)